MINQKEITSRLRTQLGYRYSQPDIDIILRTFVSVIVDAVSHGEDVNIVGLGKFYGRFIKGKHIAQTGLDWIKDKQFTIPNRFRLGFRPAQRANKQVEQLIEKVTVPKQENNA